MVSKKKNLFLAYIINYNQLKVQVFLGDVQPLTAIFNRKLIIEEVLLQL